jgi:hypothetical protein
VIVNSYTFEVVVGKNDAGEDVRETVTIEASNFLEARHKLTEFVQQQQKSAAPN